MTEPARSIPSTSYGPHGTSEVVGRTEPRLWTPPLRELTPETSYGFAVIQFARDVLKAPLDPWQCWLVIHAGELLEDGRPRFRKVLVLVARQNGKTHLLVVLTLFWIFIECVAMVLGTSTKLDYAAESWRKACKLARRVPRLKAEISHRGAIRKANGEQVLWRADADEQETEDGSRYKIAASNDEGGRSLTIDRLVLDELRQHHDYSAHDASVPATNAVPDAQIFALSNQGSAKSVVLNDWRDDALTFIETGEGDYRLGIFEWSAPDGSSPVNLDALAQANPNLGHRIDPDALLGDARTAMRKGGAKLAGFKVENMCMAVHRLNPAIDPDSWEACKDVGDLAAVRDRVVLLVDVAPDGEHASLTAAAVLPVDEQTEPSAEEDPERPSSVARVEVVRAWSGPDCMTDLRRELRPFVSNMEVKPRAVGWFPSGPAAELITEMAADEDAAWPPEGVEVVEIRKDVPAVCMSFAGQVRAGLIAHSDDPLLTAQALGAEKLFVGERWVFTRKGAGHVDAVYGAAGAVHLARTLPPPPKPMPRSKIV